MLRYVKAILLSERYVCAIHIEDEENHANVVIRMKSSDIAHCSNYSRLCCLNGFRVNVRLNIVPSLCGVANTFITEELTE